MQSNEIKISYFEHPIYKDYRCDENGNIYSFKFGKIRLIKPFENNFGYLVFIICYNGNRKHYLVHRFIYECVNNQIIENGFEIDHIDKNKKNNKFSNLRIVSKLTNNLNRYENEEVDGLPEDSIKIIKYNDYLFKIQFKEWQNKVNGKIYLKYSTQINDINNKPVNIYLNKLRRDLGY